MNMTPQQAANWMNSIPGRVETNIRDAEMNTIITGRGIAWGQTMGPYKLAYLRKFKPGRYSRKSPSPPGDPGRINTQSGVLARSWQASQGIRASDIVTTLFNESESAKHIAESGKGGSRMMHRPVEERIADRILPIRIHNLSEAIRKALTP
jgi:hypothetical protein